MPNIEYKITELFPKVFVFIVPDNYIRAMLFLRIQEFYESKNRRFKGKKFSFWDYKEWYSSIKKGNFTYTSDWSGFNVPLKVAIKCKGVSKIETPYDREMNKSLNKICKMTDVKKAYLLGVDSIESSIFKHEVAHALYYTNKEYKKSMDQITKLISVKKLKAIKTELKKWGYCEKVLMDEIQAYLSTEKSVLTKNLPKETLKKYRNNFDRWYIIKNHL